MVTGSPAQIGLGVATVILTAGVMSGSICITIWLELADAGFTHVALEIKRASTISPSFRDEVTNVVPVAVKMPFTLQLITGAVPPLAIAELNVTCVPTHTGPAGETEMEMAGIGDGVIPATIIFENTVGGTGQGAEDVMLARTSSPLLNEEVANVLELPPAGIPFTVH
jgi:hypothetical protein